MRRQSVVLIAAVIVTVALTAAGCKPSTDGITTGDVKRATVVEVVDVPASVTARAVATLNSPADGTIARLSVQPGATVRKGTIVAVIDSPSARKRLADAKAALSAASGFSGGSSVNLGGVQRSLDTAAADAFASATTAAEQVSDEKVRQALLAQIAASQKHYNAVAATSRRLLSQVQRGLAGIGEAMAALGAAQRAQAKAAFDLAKAGVDALTLRAPITGVVQFARPAPASSASSISDLLGAVGAGGTQIPGAAGAAPSSTSTDQNVAGVDDMLAIGDRVGAGTAVVTIVDVSEIGLAGEVDETDVLLVSDGVGADVELDAAPGVTYEATVRSIDLLPTPSARGGVAYRIRLSFNAPADQSAALPTPRPGMSAVAHLRVRTADNAVAVPAASVFTSDLGDTVWVIRNGSAVRQQVKLGVKGEDLVQVVSGVDPGDKVVTSGTDKVSAGQELT
jgi:multidrug efflux pump subunit AcrA (membrane-fusion protein)